MNLDHIPTDTDQVTSVRGACPHDCPDTCALVTTVKNGKAIKVHGNPNHAQTDGVLCAKVSRYTERTYHPERLLYPMKRSGPKGSGQFTRITWGEALDTVAKRLGSIAAHNSEAILPTATLAPWGKYRAKPWRGDFFIAWALHCLTAPFAPAPVPLV